MPQEKMIDMERLAEMFRCMMEVAEGERNPTAIDLSECGTAVREFLDLYNEQDKELLSGILFDEAGVEWTPDANIEAFLFGFYRPGMAASAQAVEDLFLQEDSEEDDSATLDDTYDYDENLTE